MYKLQLNTNTKAFEQYGHRGEIYEALRQAAHAILSGNDNRGTLSDSHGNQIGSWRYEPDKELDKGCPCGVPELPPHDVADHDTMVQIEWKATGGSA